MFKRRIGLDPHSPGGDSPTSNTCPDIWELEDGSFAVIGRRKTAELKGLLPPTAGCADYEEIVVIPRGTLLAAKNDIPFE